MDDNMALKYIMDGGGWQLLICLFAPIFILVTPSGRAWTIARALLVLFFAWVFLGGARRIHGAIAVGLFYPLVVWFALTLALWAIRASVWRTARGICRSVCSRARA